VAAQNAASTPSNPVIGKKRPGRPKKIKKEDPLENIVSSSSQVYFIFDNVMKCSQPKHEKYYSRSPQVKFTSAFKLLQNC